MKKKLILIPILVLILVATLAIGCTGEQGIKGLKGATGEQGIQGEQGVQGEQGLQGIRGKQGEQGEQGEVGLQGVMGRPGAKGATGSVGATGEQGIQGLKGYSGATGATGATGAIGPQGIQGPQGIVGPQGDLGDPGPPLNYLVLVAKDSGDWSIETNAGVGYLLYGMVSPEFMYAFWATGLEAEEDYSLIYYTDTEDRYVDWGGKDGAVLATFTSDSGGNIDFEDGATELEMHMPNEDDANSSYYDYTVSDGYAHPFGAKIWLVPSDCLSEGGELPVIVWAPNRFLFETDLIYYIDTNLGE